MMSYIDCCRLCKHAELESIFDFGNQYLTGYFPKAGEQVKQAPLNLVKCTNCSLLQLNYTVPAIELYNNNYGYQSSLNKSMVEHLHNISRKIRATNVLTKDDLIIDIGSNDGSFLQNFADTSFWLYGVDPIAERFIKNYPSNAWVDTNLFSSRSLHKIPEHFPRKAKIITSIAMFYDLQDPLSFIQTVYDSLADDGLWIMEIQYAPTLINLGVYDFICHEHLCYFGTRHLKTMCKQIGFYPLYIEFNEINGGSILCILSKRQTSVQWPDDPRMDLEEYKEQIINHKEQLSTIVKSKRIVGYGASTKGNVVLQYCNFTHKDIMCIGEVNQDKFGCYTPGTNIPIIDEKELVNLNPEYYLVLPWHFRSNIVERNPQLKGKLLFPFPKVEVL